MNHFNSTPIRRLGAWVMCLLLITMQLVMPMVALAAADLAGLPTVTLYYFDAEGNQRSLLVGPSLNGESPVFWATLPQEAFQFPPITVEIPPMGGVSYTPEAGTPISTGDAMDFMSASTTIYVYLDGEPIDSYPLYVSSAPMPMPEQMPEPDPEPVTVSVPVIYQVKDDGTLLHDEEVPCTYNVDNVISVNRDVVPTGYSLVSDSTVSVTVDEMGNAYPSLVIFEFKREETDPPVGEETDPPAGEQTDPPVSEETDPPVSEETDPPVSEETDPPSGEPSALTEVGRYAQTIKNNMNFRTEPSTKSAKAFASVSIDTYVWVIGTLTVNGEEWAKVFYKNTECYVAVDLADGKEYINILSQQDSDAYNYTQNQEAQAPSSVDVTVSYVDADNSASILDTQTISCVANADTEIVANLSGLAGYAVVGDDRVTVNVSESGKASQETVVFTVQKILAKGTITVRHITADNQDIIPSQTVEKTQGKYDVTPNADAVSQEYVLMSAGSVSVTIDASGNATPDVVNFTYEKTLAKGTFTVRHITADNQDIISPQTVEKTQGKYDVTPNADAVPQDYVLKSAGSVSVTIDASGNATPDVVNFTYEKTLAKGTFTIRHITADNQNIISPQTVEKTQGKHDVTPNTDAVPKGYVLKSAGSVSVTIDASGNVTPNVVSFTYEKPTITGTVDVLYKDTMNATIATTEKRTLTEGDNAISPNASVIPQGYTLQAGTPSSVNVVLRADGTVDPKVVTFVYEKATPQKVAVSVNYVDSIGQSVGAVQTVEFNKAGTYTIAAEAVPTGYVLSASTPKSYTVTVDGKLVATPASVSFKCEKPAQSAKVIVNYVYKADNTILATETLELAPGTQPKVMPNAQKVPAGYSLAEGSTLYVEVSVSAQGIATPNAVTFYYKKTEADQYEGYGLTTARVALRSDGSMNDSAIITTLEKDTLLYVKRQFDANGVRWSEVQQVLGNNLRSGFVQDDQIRHITPAEAQVLIDKYNQANATPTPAPWVAPAQVSGYYVTIMNSVPVRTIADSYAEVHSWLPYDTVVYVSGQLFPNQQTWHISTYDNYTGYIRADQLRKMTEAEVEAYQQSQANPIDTNTTLPTPDPNANSSYGYVTSSNVNFRQSPNGAKIKTLNKYVMVMIYGSQVVNGKTWYNVNQGGTIGWIHGDFLQVMTLTQFSSFINSNEYYQGLANSTSGTSSGTSGTTSSGTSSSTGTASAGTISSVEDWNVGTWQNSGSGTGINASYEPFDPYASPAPSDLPEASASIEPTSTFVIGTMIPIDYEDESKETQTGSSPWGLIAAGVVLVGGAGGVYVYALNQNNKRKAAARAAAANRRNGQPIAGGAAAAGNKQQGAQSPYARRAVAAPPAAGAAGASGVAGAKQTQGGQGAQGSNMRPTATGAASQPNPFASTGTASNAQGLFTAPMGSTQQNAQNPYARPTNQSSEPTTSSTAAAPQTSKNPYVQPLGNAGAGNETTPETARRAGRTQRYQSTEGDDGKA